MASQHSKDAPRKPKLVRDSFTIPKNEFAAIEALKARAISLGTSVKKSELLRAGLMALQGLGDAAYKAALGAVPTLKTGRPVTEKAVARPAAGKSATPKRAPKKPAAAKAESAKTVATKTSVKKPAVRKPAAKAAPGKAPAKAPAKA